MAGSSYFSLDTIVTKPQPKEKPASAHYNPEHHFLHPTTTVKCP